MNRFVSSRFPYLPIRLQTAQQEMSTEALVDTGFDGDIMLPPDMLEHEGAPDFDLMWRLADGSRVHTPGYVGVMYLGDLPPESVVIAALGSEPLIGRTLVARFLVTLDRGERVVVEL